MGDVLYYYYHYHYHYRYHYYYYYSVVGGIRELFLDVSLVIMSLFPLINNVLCIKHSYIFKEKFDDNNS